MKLYHGTNQVFDTIDLTCGAIHKDFGKGFYLTPDRDTAERMAKKRTWLDGGDPNWCKNNKPYMDNLNVYDIQTVLTVR